MARGAAWGYPRVVIPSREYPPHPVRWRSDLRPAVGKGFLEDGARVKLEATAAL